MSRMTKAIGLEMKSCGALACARLCVRVHVGGWESARSAGPGTAGLIRSDVWRVKLAQLKKSDIFFFKRRIKKRVESGFRCQGTLLPKVQSGAAKAELNVALFS